MTPAEGSGNKRSNGFWKTIYTYARPYRLLMVISVISTMVTGFMAAVQPLLIRYIIDEGIARENASGAEKMLATAAFAGIYLLAGGLRMGAWATGYRRAIAVIEGVLFRIRSRFFRHVQDLCLRFHNDVSSGELFNYIMGTPVSTLKQFLSQSMTMVPEHTVTLAVSISMLSFFDWQMTLIMCVVALVLAWINSRSRRLIKEMNADFMKTESMVSRFVADMLRGTRAIKLYAIEETVSTRFDSRIHEIRAKSERNTFRQWLEYAKTEAFHYFSYAVIYLYGAYSCVYRGLTIGEFLAFVTSLHAIMGPFMTFLQLNLLHGSAEAGLERIEKILNTEKTTPELEPALRKTLDAARKAARGGPTPAIEFRSVRFSYQPQRPVFENLSCSIRQGESVALVGPSGSGKTTFANLLLRLYDPQSGSVAVYGNDIRQYALQDLRTYFGVVPQDPFLFQATLLDNIRVARPDAPDADVMKAVEAAHIAELVRQLPDGLDTFIGESGFNLSGGQRQRVAIARAILGEPGFLLFDEATSALDNESEYHVQQAIESIMESHTIIVIAHRLSTIRNVDRILVFDRGSIVQEGSFDELSEAPGVFRGLLQRSGFVRP